VKVRYQFLDALRGYAAIGVVLFHIGTRFGGIHTAVNGYVAVDFFFILSGFVLAGAYEDRLASNLGLAKFFILRAIRLMPMAVFSVVAGTGYLLLRYHFAPELSDPVSDILAASLLNLFLLPKLWLTAATRDETFPANGPLWSLSMEVAANLIWARFLVGARLATLIAVCGAGGALIVIMSLWKGTGDLGWNAYTYLGGIGRITFGFTLGVILFRTKDRIRLRSPVWPYVALFLLTLSIFLPIHHVAWFLACVLVLLPFAVACGMSAGDRRFSPLDDVLGRISYPLYAIHYPILMMGAGLEKKFGNGAGAPILSLAIFSFIIAASYLLMRFFDEPVRKYLTALYLNWRPAFTPTIRGPLQ
jgi:peptidoglycan/LPS O-acetylase OafA/YrhL